MNILPEFDFTIPIPLTVEQRFENAVQVLSDVDSLLRELHYSSALIPSTGLSPDEISRLEAEMEIKLPEEYAAFLRRWRYLEVSQGHNIHGVKANEETDYPGWPWVSDKHEPPRQHLVLGYCNDYADGDQLLIDLDDPEQRVFLYLHEAWVYLDVPGSKIELYAPSFSLAVWRLVYD